MAQKQARWTLRAINDKIAILDYWINRNKSTTSGERIDQLFDKALEQLKKFPDQGKKTDYKNIRIKIVRSYLFYNLIEDDYITVVGILDGKRDPKNSSSGEQNDQCWTPPHKQRRFWLEFSSLFLFINFMKALQFLAINPALL